MIHFYPLVKSAHVALVLASGALFAARGLAVLRGAAWPMLRPVRLTSQVVDTSLLLAGVTLLAMLSLNPAKTPWLAAKLALLPLYIVLGSLALKRARSARAAWFAAAIGCFVLMFSIARTHDPRGLFSLLAT